MQLPVLIFTSDDDNIIVMVSDISDPTSNSYKITLANSESPVPEFMFHFKMENIKILQGDYKINFANNIVGEFVNKNIPLKYWFAMEANTSRYDG
jgi:hypothetical protein